MQKEIKYIIKQLKNLLSQLLNKYNKQLPYIIISIIAVIIVIGGIALFTELTENLKTEELKQLDTTITQLIMSHRSASLTQYFVFVTHVGDVYGYIVVSVLCTLIFYLIFKSWHYAVQLGVVMILALSSNIILKQIINRSRPELEHLVTVETLSYPSGHAMTAMAFYGFLIYLFYRFKINRLSKWIIIVLLSLLILSIGISRIYLGVHFPSDVLGGFIAGFIWVILCALIFNIITLFKKDPSTLN